MYVQSKVTQALTYASQGVITLFTGTAATTREWAEETVAEWSHSLKISIGWGVKNSISHSFGDVIWIKISPKSGRLLSFCSQQSAGIRRSDIAVWCALHGSRPNKKHVLAECPHDVFITKYHQSFFQIQNTLSSVLLLLFDLQFHFPTLLWTKLWVIWRLYWWIIHNTPASKSNGDIIGPVQCVWAMTPGTRTGTGTIENKYSLQ